MSAQLADLLVQPTKAGGEHKGEVADGGDEAVVFVNADVVGFGADGFGQGGDFADGALAGLGAGDDAVGFAGEQVAVGVFGAGGFASGHRVAADEIYGVGEQFVSPLQHLAFGAAHVGDDAAFGQVGGEAGHQLAHRQDGGGEDDDVGIVDGVAKASFHTVEGLAAGCAGAGAVVGVGADDGEATQGGGAQGQAQGGAD